MFFRVDQYFDFMNINTENITLLSCGCWEPRSSVRAVSTQAVALALN